MGNPLQTIPNLPPAINLSGEEQFWINQAGVDRRAQLVQLLGIVGGGGEGATTVGDYTELRTAGFPLAVTTIVLNDPWKGGIFVRGPPNTDNGGTRIVDVTGQTWYRLYDERISAAWFYSAPPDANGNPTTLGSGPTTITAADVAANPQWVGLADDGGVGVQIAGPYPVGTYWDFVCLQEWIYACAADRSASQSVFVGSMAGGQVTISQWISGEQHLVVGQPITGPNVQPGTIVVAATADPNVYWTGHLVNTAGLDMTTASGNTFHGYIEGTDLTIHYNLAKPVTIGDQIIDPLTPPNPYYSGVLPGTVIGPQISGAPLGIGDYNAAVAQNVPSEQMTSGGPLWNTVGGANYLNVPGFCPRGTLYLNQMLVCDGDGLDLFFASKLGTSLNWYGNASGTSKVGPAVKLNTVDYSVIKSLYVNDVSGGVTNYLVSVSHTSNAPGLNVQNNTFHDWLVRGNYTTSQTGVAVSPEGGAAQGDTQVFIQCWAVGFNNGFTFGGANAIAGTFFGGQTQACPQYGVEAIGGSFSAYTMLCENSITSYYAAPQRTQIHLGGADFYAQQVGTESCVVIGCRSESVVGMIDFSHESSVTNWTCGGFFTNWAPNFHWTPGTLLNVQTVKNPVENFGVVMLADDGGPPWFKSDPSSTTTVVVYPGNPGWTVNQWAGFGIWQRGTTTASSNSIVSNTANTLTLNTPAAFPAGAPTTAWWKIFGLSGGVAPNWGATTHFGQFVRNASGWGVTIAQGFNLFSSVTPLNAGDWVMVPGFDVFPDGTGITQALYGKAVNQQPGSSGWYLQSVGTVATIWGAPTNPILLGAQPSATPFNFLIAQTAGTPGGAGTYTLAFGQTIGANFTGSVTGNQLTVTAVQNGVLAGGQSLGGAGIPSAPAPTITNAGAAITGYVDDGTGGVNPGTVLTVQSVANGAVSVGAPLSGTNIPAGTVVLSQATGTPGGVGTYNISDGVAGFTQLNPRCAFTGSIAGAVLTVTAVTAGELMTGQLIQGAGVPANMLLGAQTSGVAGGAGVYAVSVSATVASEAMTATWNLSVGGQGAAFTGVIDNGAGLPGHLLNVTAISGGVLGVGQTVNVPLTGPGVPAGLTQALPINALVSGSGGIGTYVLGGAAVAIPLTAMTANTVGGIGVYGISPAFGSVASQPMLSGYASITRPLWQLQDNYGNPMNAAKSGTDAFGYYSAGIADGALTQMVIDFDIMWGVGGMDQCQLPFGKVGAIGRMDNLGLPAPGLNSQFIRPGEGPLNQFSYKNAVTYTVPPRFGVLANATPFTIPNSFFAQANVNVTVYQNNTVLGLAALGPGMIADIDLILTPGATVGGGMIIDWDPTTVHSATPTQNIGVGGQKTIVRMKWIGSNLTSGSLGSWWVIGVQGPMT